MLIKFSPIRLDKKLEAVSVVGDALSINGQVFDFTPLPEGATLPAEAIASSYITEPVERINGEIVLTLLLPYSATSKHIDTPLPIHITADGPVKLPVLVAEEVSNEPIVWAS
jgi:hypothetical protein